MSAPNGGIWTEGTLMNLGAGSETLPDRDSSSPGCPLMAAAKPCLLGRPLLLILITKMQNHFSSTI